jgi:hypothetical protein
VAIAVRVGLFLTILAVAAGGYAIWGWRSAGRERRIAATESQVRAIAAKLAADTDEHGRLVPAAPEEADAWDQLIDIQYKSTIALDVVTATSLGPDRKPGTHDDITATRTVVPPKREIAREAVERVKDGAVNRLKRAISDRVRDESE